MHKEKATEVEVIEGDPYAYYLSIWDTEESLQERNRTMFMTLQGILLTVALIFIESNRGVAIFFSFMGLMLFTEWLPDALSRAKRISFIKWLLIEHETSGHFTRNIFSAINSLGRKCTYEDVILTENEVFKKILHDTRQLEYRVALGLFSLWIMLVTFALGQNSEAKMLGGWILSLFGAE